MAIIEYPNIGQNVTLTLVDGSEVVAYWDGEGWMVGVANDPDDVPFSNSDSIVSWKY